MSDILAEQTRTIRYQAAKIQKLEVMLGNPSGNYSHRIHELETALEQEKELRRKQEQEYNESRRKKKLNYKHDTEILESKLLKEQANSSNLLAKLYKWKAYYDGATMALRKLEKIKLALKERCTIEDIKEIVG